MPSTADDVIQTCKTLWPPNQADCSAFVKAVAAALGALIEGDADQIVQLITTSPDWTACANGVDASQTAKGSRLVVGGLTAAEIGPGQTHGHVVIVVAPSGPLAHGLYPYAYWGSLSPGTVRTDGGLGTTINYSFQASVRDNVHYASVPI
jgi:hypothetical protein